MAREAVRRITVNLDLPETDLDKISQTNGKDPVMAVNDLCRYFVREYLNGGVIVPSKSLLAIETSTGAKVGSAEDIVKCVQAARGREDGQYTLKAQIDPAWIEPIEDNARISGWTAEELLQNALNWVLGNGWLYTFSPANGACVPLEADDYKTVAEFVGKKAFSSKDLVSAIRKATVEA